MSVKLRTGIAGDDFPYSPGQIVSFDAETEKRLIASGQAEAVTAKKKVAKKKK